MYDLWHSRCNNQYRGKEKGKRKTRDIDIGPRAARDRRLHKRRVAFVCGFSTPRPTWPLWLDWGAPGKATTTSAAIPPFLASDVLSLPHFHPNTQETQFLSRYSSIYCRHDDAMIYHLHARPWVFGHRLGYLGSGGVGVMKLDQLFLRHSLPIPFL